MASIAYGSFLQPGPSLGGGVSANNLSHPSAASSTRSAVVAAPTVRTSTWEPLPAVIEAPTAQQAAGSTLPGLPQLQPISSVLAKQLKREQQQRKRLGQQLHSLERQLGRANGSSSQADSVAWVQVPELITAEADSDDPLFSSSAPPSVQQLQRLLVHRRRQLLQATSSSVSDVTRVAQQLQEISSLLGLDLNIVIPLVARHEPLLLQPAHQLPARLSLLSSALQLPPADTAQLLSASAPQLLGTSFTKLQTNLLQLGRVLSSRGLKPAEVLQARPDLLTQNPGSVEAKLEQLPGALGMSRQRVRQLISQCPDLLRRSVATIAHRYHSLRQLFSIPDSFVEEFVVQEPELLCMSADTLKAKFDSLLRRYGAFADDVLDMVLVDPALLINADPAAAPPAPTVKASRKKQQRLLEQQQQQAAALQQQQPSEQVQAAFLQATGAVDSADLQQAVVAVAASVQAEVQQQDAADSAAAAAAVDAQAQQRWQRHEGEEEPWQTVLRLRLERQQAARERRQQRRQQQQLEQQRSLRSAPLQQQRPGSSSRQSPVRRLLAFAAATGLGAEQALQLWLQEPSLSQLPAAAVAGQVAELSRALGFGDISSSSSSDGDDKPVLQVLVKEPVLLALSQQQLSDNMQGLCALLGLQLGAAGAAGFASRPQDITSLLPLLWEQPGLLLLPPEVAEYRLQHLAGLLQLSVPRTLHLVLQQPQLLTERPVLLAARLGSLCTMLGVARGVASECVLREPRVLCVGEEELQGRWEKLVCRFGWAPDALDVVMADPAALMRDSLEE